MEPYELELIEKYRKIDEELDRLWKEHLEYEKEIEKLLSKPYLTPQEDLMLKELKKKKLAGKTKMINIIQRYSQQEANNET